VLEGLAALDHAAGVILFRVPADAGALLLMHAARRRGIPLFYEDEAVPDVVPPRTSFRGLLPPAMHDDLTLAVGSRAQALQRCDAAIAPTAELAAAMAPFTRLGQAFVLPDCLAPSPGAPPATLPTLALECRGLLFLETGPERFGTALLALLQRWPEAVLTITGPVHLDPAFDAQASQIRLGPAALEGAALALIFCGGAPEAIHEAGLAWAEAAMRGLPSLLFGPEHILPQLRHGETILRAASHTAWLLAAGQALRMADLRARLGAAAHALASNLHGPEACAAKLADCLAALAPQGE
jgi:hypothetical protein